LLFYGLAGDFFNVAKRGATRKAGRLFLFAGGGSVTLPLTRGEGSGDNLRVIVTDSDRNALLRDIPAMDGLLNADWAAGFRAVLGRETVRKIIEEALDGVRDEIPGGKAGAPAGELAVRRAKELLERRAAGTLKRAVNATGVVIHTNLGRAPLAREAVEAACGIAGTYSTLEYSAAEGRREGRNNHIEWLLRNITGAEAALAVNNNAAAVLLALSALAAGREVIVSCGELVEIGDSFRIPEILSFSGARMVTAGCTNSTTIEDYSHAITENTAVLLKVHPSNYRIGGFVKSVRREELAGLAASRGLVFMEDLGSGLLCRPGLPFAEREHSVRECLEAGAGIVTFSGDKLLGGPQIGIIAGAKALTDRMRRHQLLRALRVDKMTLAAFGATLRLYLAGRQAEIPVIRMLEADKAGLLKKARRLCRLLKVAAAKAGRLPAGSAAAGESSGGSASAGDLEFSVVETEDAVGGGAFPVDILPGFGVGIRSVSRSAESLAAALRAAPIPVIAGLRGGQVVLHVRTLLDGDDKLIAAALP